MPARADPVAFAVEAASAEVRRGLDWSEGRASAAVSADAGVAGLSAAARLALLRGSRRHGGAAAVADLALGKAWDTGPVTLRAEVIGHVFAGADRAMDYGEGWLNARYALGPFHAAASAFYAPPQAALGGSNLYLRAEAGLGLPGLPLSLSASLGRSSGTADDPVRAARLRPLGRYADWRLGAAYARGPLTLALDYVGTDIAGTVPGAGHRIIASGRLAF